MDGCKEICQRQIKMEKARCPMFQQELEELRSKVTDLSKVVVSRTTATFCLQFIVGVWV